jgi:hypothetical protein
MRMSNNRNERRGVQEERKNKEEKNEKIEVM